MSKVTELGDFTNVSDPATFIRFCSRFLAQLQDTVNGQLDFKTNFNCEIVDVTFSQANVEQGITHKLNKTGLNYFVVKKSVSCDVYAGNTADTKAIAYLTSTVAGASVTLILF